MRLVGRVKGVALGLLLLGVLGLVSAGPASATSAPVLLSPPTISGIAQVGQLLKTTEATTSRMAPGYVWLFGWTPLSGTELAIAAKVIGAKRVDFTFHGKFQKGISQGLFAAHYKVKPSALRRFERSGSCGRATIHVTLRNGRHFNYTAKLHLLRIL